MQIKINQEIRDYSESVFFGLSPRQFFFSLLAVAVAVLLYFLLRDRFSTETVSWMCVLGAAPFAAMGYFQYHGMTFEQFIVVFVRSEILEPRVYLFKPKNYYYELAQAHRKEQAKQKKLVKQKKLPDNKPEDSKESEVENV